MKKSRSSIDEQQAADYNEVAQMEMPKYRSHKEVWALKIETITVLDDGSADIVPADERFGTFKVSKEYVDKHKPKKGGYYVQYEGGYESWSPADAFEKGNSLIKCNVFSFGMAIEALRIGKKVARTGWNGKGMFLFISNESSGPVEEGTPILSEIARKNQGILVRAHINMKAADDSIVIGWLASQTDILSYDWEIVE